MVVVYPTFVETIPSNGSPIQKKHTLLGVPVRKGPFASMPYDFLNGLGGKVNCNEHPLDAALRELYEECGVSLMETSLIHKGVVYIDRAGGSYLIRLHVYEWSLEERVSSLDVSEDEFVQFDVWRECDGRSLTPRDDLSILPADQYWLQTFLTSKKRHRAFVHVTKTFELDTQRVFEKNETCNGRHPTFAMHPW